MTTRVLIDRDRDVPALARFLAHYLPGKRLRVEVREYHPERSSSQNAALFGVAYPVIREATGYDVNEVHELMCGEHFGWTEHEVFGQRKRRPARTTTRNEDGNRDVLDKQKFSDFYAHVQRFCAEQGIDVPDPDPAMG